MLLWELNNLAGLQKTILDRQVQVLHSSADTIVHLLWLPSHSTAHIPGQRVIPDFPFAHALLQPLQGL